MKMEEEPSGHNARCRPVGVTGRAVTTETSTTVTTDHSTAISKTKTELVAGPHQWCRVEEKRAEIAPRVSSSVAVGLSTIPEGH